MEKWGEEIRAYFANSGGFLVIHFLFLSALCISSIEQIIKSVCASVSQSVCHTKRVERSKDRNLPPIFTKLAIEVES